MINYTKDWEISINEKLHGEEWTLTEYEFEKPFEMNTVYNIVCSGIKREERERLSKNKVLIPKKIQMIHSEGIFEAIIYFGFGFSARISKINGFSRFEVTEMAKTIYKEEMIENSIGYFDMTLMWPNMIAA